MCRMIRSSTFISLTYWIPYGIARSLYCVHLFAELNKDNALRDYRIKQYWPYFIFTLHQDHTRLFQINFMNAITARNQRIRERT